MKKNFFKQVLSAMVLTMSLAGGAAFVSANSVQYSENGDYQAAVNLSVPAVTKTADFRGYSENRDYNAAINLDVPAAVKSVDSVQYSENRDYVAASAFDNN
ncbi:hypothetical protein [Megasphaera sp. DISK 18]|uniref:hypothetical protein n=1 Tax=Megasphaera sp. DISK 18 TaxID=1776081 RepID=UPI000807035E|nr:hypothetical protein [Megasphaera sp. DISK 18]OBZ32367.1 hypothetical protein A0U42_10935 [Megasphaera sp. DISK 18]